ncbi:MAG: hypothetical protein IJP31_07890 [Lachnospiraceae bacterium]|nr:hypothetical protein [Lachnospiraceae bacterium]
MAQIKQFVPKKGNAENKMEFEDKIKKYRRSRLFKIGSLMLVVFLLFAGIYLYVDNVRYTSYGQISSVDRSGASDSTCLNHNGRVLTYSKDGISSTDAKGNVIWNETYQMQNPIVRVNENAVAVGDYNGNVIYVMDEKGKAGEIDTNLPIRDFCVSKTGVVAVVLEDTKLTRLNVYNSTGEEAVKSEVRMNQNGYPVSVSLSDNGEVMAVSYLYVDSGVMKSSVAFYNFSDVGQNSVDRLVSGNDYADTVIPYVGFLGKDAAFAIGDSRINFYSGTDKPVSVAEKLLNEEIQAAYTGGEHVALVYLDTTGASLYRLEVYDKKGNLLFQKNIEIEFQNILLEKNYIVIYNDHECIMYNMSGGEKYQGTFAKKVSLLIPTDSTKRFVMVTADTIDLIELN